ncbi:MAG: hypothetical protein U0930_01705 [Pirellulales bacterium]
MQIYLSRFLMLLALLDFVAVSALELQQPPFRGTIFDFPDLMKESDPTAFKSIEFVESAEREMFDRRINRSQRFPTFVFKVEYSDRKPLEVAVNREFETVSAAQLQAERYAIAFGRLPLLLREEIDALHIQAGNELFGGGRKVLIHTGQGERYIKDGILEETLAHEAGHALDSKFANHPDWVAAQKKDAMFISKYAEENPRREDIAESIVPYLAIRFRPDRIAKAQLETITQSIPARIEFFDGLKPSGFPE